MLNRSAKTKNSIKLEKTHMAKKTTKTATKKVAAKKAVKKKAPVKKVAAKKVAAKKASAKKAPAKKVTTKKVAAKKAPAKKVAAKKAVKKAPAKKAVKTTKAAAPKIIETSIIARVDVGFGNSLYIRGEGAGLSWDQGTLLENITPYEWAIKTTSATTPVEFKFLINDEIWSEGENLTVAAGGTSISSPTFSW